MHLKTFLRDRSGVSAVEFAFIAPLMVLIYMGLAELTLAMMADRRASHAASAAGDLVAQSAGVMKAADIDKVLFVGKAVVQPYPTAGLSMRVTSIQADLIGTPKVVWSRTSGTALTPLSKGSSVVGFPAGMLAANEGLIQSEVQYAYDTPLKKIINRTLQFKSKFYLRPRRVDIITCSDCP